ncbi:hypothetical protein D5086_030704 [Populus alba]|uniref:Uncharacterized protein n=1 Tax=Populus alba TaxID=43335 RepID=A0ACC4AQK7_POPAL
MATAKSVKDVSPHEFVKAYSAHLKRSGKIELPLWTDIVKTGTFKELAPYDPDWYYVRAASMARKIYIRGGLGVGAFRRIYGGSKRNGSRPPHFCKSSGSVARHILQQLQNVNIIDIDPKGGRRITSSGQRDLDQVAGRIVPQDYMLRRFWSQLSNVFDVKCFLLSCISMISYQCLRGDKIVTKKLLSSKTVFNCPGTGARSSANFAPSRKLLQSFLKGLFGLLTFAGPQFVF